MAAASLKTLEKDTLGCMVFITVQGLMHVQACVLIFVVVFPTHTRAETQ